MAKQTIEIDVPIRYEIDYGNMQTDTPEYHFDGTHFSTGYIRVHIPFKLTEKTKKNEFKFKNHL
jgi:hypothetical protein